MSHIVLDDNQLRALLGREDFHKAFPFIRKQVTRGSCSGCKRRGRTHTVVPDLATFKNTIAAFSKPQLAKLRQLLGATSVELRYERTIRGRRVTHKLRFS